jgi:hypothetical protein
MNFTDDFTERDGEKRNKLFAIEHRKKEVSDWRMPLKTLGKT